MLVLEGMPGAGKTTVADALTARGVQVIGEYVTSTGTTLPMSDHPAVHNDDAHQANWLAKHRLVTVTGSGRPVVCDRDWISALAYAASLDDGGQLLRHRTSWAREQLTHGRLAVATDYLVFRLAPPLSLARRSGRLTPGHPWSTPPGLHRLARFYADPIGAIGATSPALRAALGTATWHQLDAGSVDDAVRFALTLLAAP